MMGDVTCAIYPCQDMRKDVGRMFEHDPSNYYKEQDIANPAGQVVQDTWSVGW